MAGVLAALATLIAALGGLYFNVQTIQQATQQSRMTDRAQASERFSRSVEQLGSENVAVRIGAVHSFAGLMRDSPGDRETVVEILSSFVRLQTDEFNPREHWQTPHSAATRKPRPPSDVQAAISVLDRQPVGDLSSGPSMLLGGVKLKNLNLSGIKMRHAMLHDADISKSVLVSSDLSRANLRRVDLSESDLMDANLKDADLTFGVAARAYFDSADLDGANISRALLKGATFDSASLVGVRFFESSLPNTDFTEADLTNADLTRASFRGARLHGANLTGANITQVDFSGADLTKTTLDDTTIDRIWCNSRTKWPRDFTPPECEAGWHEFGPQDWN